MNKLKNIFEEILSRWSNARRETFKGHPIAKMVRDDLKEEIVKVLSTRNRSYQVKGSVGAGNWADTPWVSILDLVKTKSTQEGVYPVYLFCADGSGFYLSLGFGTTELKKIYGAIEAKKRAAELASHIRKHSVRLSKWFEGPLELKGNTSLSKSYEWATAGSKYYSVSNIPSDDDLIKDLSELLEIYDGLPENITKADGPSTQVLDGELDIKTLSIPKPFILLAGISGTGKTRFVRKQAESSRVTDVDNYCLVPVRPDWHEPDDLLGYVTRLSQSGTPEYVPTKVLKFIVDAWKVSAVNANANGVGDVSIKAPCWLCLDEMNLAPVEQYFSDYLSVLESREYEDGIYKSKPLLDQSTISVLESKSQAKLKSDLGLDGCDDLWDYFVKYGVGIPPNLIVAGTVNMDETTHGFSRKVIDRAFTLDFGEFYPNDFDHFFKSDIENVVFTPSLKIQANLSDFTSVDADNDSEKSKHFLLSVNSLLKSTPFELAYRSLNELYLFVANTKPKTDKDLQAVWDDFLMCKVLPRIDGDDEKLTVFKDGSSINLLEAMAENLEALLGLIWNETRPDLFRVTEVDKTKVAVQIKCRSKAKLEWMRNRLEQNTFTSFWP